MVQLTNRAKEDLFHLFYYPFTLGRQMEYSVNVFRAINNTIISFQPTSSSGAEIIPSIGKFHYTIVSNIIVIQFFVWLPPVQRFFFTKANFIRIAATKNIASVHPSFYKECSEPSFVCDNGYKIVKRASRGRILYNFKDLDGRIVSDIDFTQVKPFSIQYNMTARGYTPDRRCYIVFDNGAREETNEAISKKSHIIISEDNLRRIISESIQKVLWG